MERPGVTLLARNALDSLLNGCDSFDAPRKPEISCSMFVDICRIPYAIASRFKKVFQ